MIKNFSLFILLDDELVFEKSATSNAMTDSIQTLTLINVGDKVLTFKIKTTSPDKFRVKPGCSLLLPGGSASVYVYLLKAYCTSSSNINKEKFLIIWTLVDYELKQTQLVEFWKNIPNSLLHEHRLKCSFNIKSSLSIVNDHRNETNVSHPIHSDHLQSDITEMQKTLKETLALQQTIMTQTSNEFARIQYLLYIIFALLAILLLWDISKYFLSRRTNTEL